MNDNNQKAVNDVVTMKVIMGALALWLLLFSLAIFAQSGQQQVKARLDDYRSAYPEIEFIVLNTVNEFDAISPLSRSLGKSVVNLDYEHPEALREQLIELQEYRIDLMLDEGSASASLFGTPDAEITAKPYSCLITLNKSLLGRDQLAATRMMYNLDDEQLSVIPKELHLDNSDFLLYAIDHEVFHCVDVYMNGFLYPQTYDPLKACNDRAQAELKAEVFSLMAHLSRTGMKKGMLKNLVYARTFSLLDWDVEHYTVDIINDISQLEIEDSQNIKVLVNDALKYARDVRPTFPEYIEFLTAAWVVTQKYGLEKDDIPAECHVLEDNEPDPEKIIELSADINEVLQAMNYSP